MLQKLKDSVYRSDYYETSRRSYSGRNHERPLLWPLLQIYKKDGNRNLKEKAQSVLKRPSIQESGSDPRQNETTKCQASSWLTNPNKIHLTSKNFKNKKKVLST